MDKYTELKEKLETEKKLLEKELGTLGRRTPGNPSDWEALPEDLNLVTADKNSMADNVESFEEVNATQGELEQRFNEVTLALKRIEDGVYGICHICNKKIEEERLNANPAAHTCIEHRNE